VLPQAAPNGQQQEQVQQKEAGNKNAAPAVKAPAPGTVKVKGKDGKERTITLHPTHVMACFDLKTGKVLWQRWIDSDVMSAAVAVDDEIFFSTFAGTVYKFKTDGQIVSALRSRATSAPVVVGEDVYFTRRDDDADGTVREAISGNRRDSFAQNSLILSRKAVYLDKTVQSKASFKTKSAQLDADNGFGGGAPASANAQEALSNIGYANVSSLQAFQGSRILHMQSRNYNTMGNEIICNDPRTGKMLWSYQLGGDQKKTGGFMGTAPAAAGGDLFVATIKGEILQLNAKDGKVRKTYKVGSPVRFQPVVMNGRIYVGTQDGKVICINTGDKKLTGWSTWGGNAQHTGVQH